jgi:Ca2+-binding EF-hand superfamily protein
MESTMKWFKTTVLLMLLLGIMLVSGCTSARKEDSAFDKKAVFNAIDKDHDGKIRKKEYRLIWKDKKMAEEYFDRLDKDDNGLLTEDEFLVPWVTGPLR